MSKITIFILPLTLCLTGCRQAEPIDPSKPICFNASAEQTSEAARTVLRKLDFSLEKDDPQSGYLRTRPLTAAQYFQFWRQDNADAYKAAQANMQSLRRVVELQVQPGQGTTCVTCRVQIQQLSLPERPVEGEQNMASAFTAGDRRQQSIRIDERRLAKMEWLDAGGDPALEERILQRLRNELE